MQVQNAIEPSEAQMHAACVEWLRVMHKTVICHHSPNEGERGWQGQRQVKRGGVQAGWPDLELFHAGRVLFVELKRSTGRLSVEQKRVHEALRRQGFRVELVRSFYEFETLVNAWMQGEREDVAP